MSQLRYEKLHPEFGASLRGIDLGKPLAPDADPGDQRRDRPVFVRLLPRSVDG